LAYDVAAKKGSAEGPELARIEPEEGSRLSPLDETRRDWQNRIERCRDLAHLMRGETAGTRLVALAREIEQQLQKQSELLAVAKERQRQCSAILAEIDGVLDRTRLELSLSQLRPNQCYSADDLREEAQLCREESLNGHDIETRRAFAGRASQLAMMGEALLRKEGEG
jgi:hypothetical protein